MGLCEAAERKRGGRVGLRWWEQAGIDLAAAAEAAAAETAAEEAEEYGLEE